MMPGDELTDEALPTVVARPPVLQVRALYAIAGVLLLLVILPTRNLWLALAALVMLAGAYATGVARLWVDDEGLARRDALGRPHHLAWSDVRAVELRDGDWRRMETGTSMVVVGHDGQEIPLFSFALPSGTRHARQAVVQHAKARGIDLVDRRQGRGRSAA